MPDYFTDDVADALRKVLNLGPRAIQSGAPGGGPEADREDNRQPGQRIGRHIPKGNSPLGYGGYGDPAVLDDDQDAEVAREIRAHVRAAQNKGLREPRPSGRLRFNRLFSPEGHNDDGWRFVSGGWSLFDGTASAAGAGTSTQVIPVSMPSGAVSPVMLLNRYPGAQFMQVYIRTIAWVPTGTTGTGLQELYFQGLDGAVAAMGIYNAATPSYGLQSVGALLTTPLTDPGNAPLGNIIVQNIGMGGSPTTVRWQLGVTFVAAVPDPWFNEQVIVPPRPAELAEALRSMEA